VDYLGRRHLTNCAGGRDVSHAEVAADILEAAAWIKGQALVASDKIYVIGWLCVPKTKSERIDDEARPRWRAKLWRRIAEPDERPAHPFAKTDAF
jgi:hypothetical protein